ncbi:hypothetical protein UT300005_28410 [Clostridium sp. CTA-5]
MNKNLKILLSTLIIGISCAGAIPANAATVPMTKPSGTISPAWVSEHQPKNGEGYSKLWCTGYHVRVRMAHSSDIAAYLDVGDCIEDVSVRNGYAYYYMDKIGEVRVSANYLTTRKSDV